MASAIGTRPGSDSRRQAAADVILMTNGNGGYQFYSASLAKGTFYFSIVAPHEFVKFVTAVFANKEKRQDLNWLCLFTYGSLNAVVLVRGHSPF